MVFSKCSKYSFLKSNSTALTKATEYGGKWMKVLIQLFITFMRIGGLTFGGGYAMLPMLEKEAVERQGWVTNSELLDYYAVAQCTPGIIAGNTAALIGYKVKGAVGALAAALGVVFPSYVIITIIAAFINNFTDLPVVQNAFAGIQVCVAALILSAIAKLWKNSVVDTFTLLLFVITFIIMMVTALSPAIAVIVMAAVGIMYKGLHKVSRGDEK